MTLEQEIKLNIISDQPPDLTALDWLQNMVISRETLTLRTDYFDTPSLKLRQMGVALRLRKIDNEWQQTVKSSGQVKDGLHQREEWDQPLLKPEFDLALLRQTPLAVIVDDSGSWKQLKLLFTTAFTREVTLLNFDETEIELAYDFGEVTSEGLSAPIHEIELELRHGDLAKLQQLAERLKTELNLAFNNSSKAALGYQLFAETKQA